MSFIGSLFSDSKGAGFQAQGANVTSPSTQAQADQTYNQAQGSYSQQAALAQAMQQQGGLQKQSDTYNQLQGVANGTGPNPAQAMLAQATGANTANQAALMAGQRGAGSNAGLIARQAAQQGAANQQGAIGQGATLQANQSLGALGQQAGMANQMAGQQIGQTNANTAAAMGMNGQVLGGIQGQNNANVGMQSNVNSTNAGIAAGNQKAQAGLVGGLMNAAGSALPMLAQGGMIKPHYAEGTPAGGVQPAAPAVQKPKTSAIGGILRGMSSPTQGASSDPVFDGMSNFASGVGSAVGGLFKKPNQDPVNVSQTSGADMLEAGGADPYMVEGTKNAYALHNNLDADSGKPMMAGGGMFNLTGDDAQKSSGPNPAMMAALLAKGGKVPAMVSPGEIYLKPEEAREVAKGKKSPMSGEKIPGKAAVKGNSLKNDTVPKTLETGGVVIPRSVLEGPKAHQNAYKFVNAVLAKSAMKPKGKK